MIFSQRYLRALKEGKFSIELPHDVRAKLKTFLRQYDASFYVQRDPHDNWSDPTSVLEEALRDLMTEQGWERIPGAPGFDHGISPAFAYLVEHGPGEHVFDLIELALSNMENEEKEKCRLKINQIFDLHDCPWRLADGEFFKLDADFMGARLSAGAHDHLVKNSFEGAADEYAKARQEIAAGDVKDGIIHAGKSFESVMKVMTGLEHANADALIKKLVEVGYFDDLPDTIKNGFAEQVLKSLPFLRNKLAGHGQGAKVVDVPLVYGELAIQLAAAFHNFLISKHIERHPRDSVLRRLLPSVSFSVRRPENQLPQ